MNSQMPALEVLTSGRFAVAALIRPKALQPLSLQAKAVTLAHLWVGCSSGVWGSFVANPQFQVTVSRVASVLKEAALDQARKEIDPALREQMFAEAHFDPNAPQTIIAEGMQCLSANGYINYQYPAAQTNYMIYVPFNSFFTLLEAYAE